MSSEIRTIAVLGTGIMGARIARNLAAADFDIRVWNRTRAKAQELAGERITVWDEPAAAAQSSQVTITALADGDAVHEAMSGLGGALYAMTPEAIWIQMSAIGIESTEDMIELAERARITFVDAPLVGTKGPAEAGQLIVLASGHGEDTKRCDPIFAAIAARTVTLDRAGQGTRMKLVIDNWVLALTSALAESIALARALDTEPRSFLEIISGGPTDADHAQVSGDAMIAGEFPANLPLRHAGKDARLVIEAAQSAGLHLALMSAASERFSQADEAGFGDEDMAAVFRAIEDGGELPPEID